MLYCNISVVIINIKYYLFSDYLNFKWKGCYSDKAKIFSSDILFMQESDSDKVLQLHCHASTFSSALAVLPDSFLSS